MQAENEDEMVLWISAIRRCSITLPGRPIDFLRRATSTRISTLSDTDNADTAVSKEEATTAIVKDTGIDPVVVSEDIQSENSDEKYSAVMLRLQRTNVNGDSLPLRNPEAEKKLINFLLNNNSCAECSAMSSIKYDFQLTV